MQLLKWPLVGTSDVLTIDRIRKRRRKKTGWPRPEASFSWTEWAKHLVEALIGSSSKHYTNGALPVSSVELIFWCSPHRDPLLSSFHVEAQLFCSHEHISMALHMHRGLSWDKFRHIVYFLDIWGLKSKVIHWHNHPLNAGWGIKLPLMFSGLQTGLATIVIFVA